ncbi:putative Penguin [Hibiscus syriacus]|uniref:Penguin n=1 Tax=Hibiscus syriacus TaxID=106335 RepID=A0A6A3AMQ0_HIBSY|nr:chaperone protein dnaJ A7A, chloroplastic-like [Hibiscus syriacus]KAE8704535.1 putative Penguin [Hibiscus syriacus]
MGRIGRNSEISEGEKPELVLEICSMSTIPIACPHKNHSNNTHFVDWYRLLGVAENAGFQLIKRRYHNLALQLHPDKNKHPKAEIAFTLVSEAYACLSDNTKRRAFNIERWKHFCYECNGIPFSNDNPLFISERSSNYPGNCSKSGKFLRNLREIRDRFKEEIRVIENSLRANRREFAASTSSGYGSKVKIVRESRVFVPSDYVLEGYPHMRDQMNKKSERIWELKRASVDERGRHHSPIFQNSSETGGMFRGMLKSRSVSIHSFSFI